MEEKHLKELKAYFEVTVNSYDLVKSFNEIELKNVAVITFPNEELHREINEEINKEVINVEYVRELLTKLHLQYQENKPIK